MSKFSLLVTVSCLSMVAALSPLPAMADVTTDVETLEKRIDQQQKQINEQKKEIDALLKAVKNSKAEKATSAATAPAPNGAVPPVTPPVINQQTQTTVTSNTPPAAPAQDEERARPQVELLTDEGGVLSPKGMLTFESTTEYTNTTRNLFTFNGVELAQVVLVGAVNNTTARHQIVEETGRVRLGITDRLEADIHVPFVYRNDALTTTQSGVSIPSTVEGYDIGDIDAGLAYQMNNGNEGWPFLIANLRYKANNADGPYDVSYNANNIANRLPVGTGFQTVQASVTAIKVSDPAVLFANLGYVYDVPRDIGKNFNGTYVTNVNPGDAINALVGMSFAINQETSFSLGYKHSYVFSTAQNQLVSGVASQTNSGSSQVGALTMGLTYAVTPTMPINFNLEAGVTNDAPDVHLTLRVPFQVGKVF